MKQCILLAMIDSAVSGWPSLNTSGFLFLHKQNLLMEKKIRNWQLATKLSDV